MSDVLPYGPAGKTFKLLFRGWWAEKCYWCVVLVVADTAEQAIARLQEYARADGLRNFEIQVEEEKT